jgi:cobalt-zinc-cadmium efflux system membrane fusion protein
LKKSIFTLCTIGAMLIACSDSPLHLEITQQPIVQNNQLRFPAGNPQLSLLSTVAVKQAENISIDLPARIVWDEQKTQRVFPAFSGRVKQILVDVGQSVSEGTLLAQIASPEFGAAQADTARAMADALLAGKNFVRQKELFNAGITSQKEFEQSEADSLRAKAEVDRAQAKTALYGSGAGVNQQLGIRSSLRGMVVERNLNPDQEIRPDQFGPNSPALFVVTDPRFLWVLIDVRETDIQYIKMGMKMDIKTPSLPNQLFEATIRVIADTIDPMTRTIKVRASIENPQRILKNEMLATASFLRSFKNNLNIPASSVFLKGSDHIVFVEIEPGVFQSQKVSLIFENKKDVIVEAGLSIGEKVVSQNGLLLAKELLNAQENAQQAPMKVPAIKP